MLINTELSPDTLALSQQKKRTEVSNAGYQAPASTQTLSTASQADLLFQRLTEASASLPRGDGDLTDGAAASQVMNSLAQSMRNQPGAALASQANQLSENVLSLLQPTD